MKTLGLAKVHRLKSIFRLCLCLAVVGIIILGSAERTTAASSATGSLPEIKVFSAEPLTLKDGDSALYTFVVSGATNIQLIEAGAIIKEINSPPDTTLKGTVKGRTTYQIRTGNMDTFNTVLRGSNPSGQREQRLSIVFATKFKPKPAPPPATKTVSDNASTKARLPKWLPPTTSSVPSTLSTTYTRSAHIPSFAQCPSGCNCLTPDEAAGHGFTQKCSEEPCFYAENEAQRYCYSKSKSTKLVIESFTANPVQVAPGEVVVLTWVITGEGDAYLTCGGEKTSVSLKGSMKIRPQQSGCCNLEVSNKDSSDQAKVCVTVVQSKVEVLPPVINSFTASCPQASPAARTVSTCTLSWNVSGPAGTTATISGIGNVGLSGSTQVQAGTYTLYATSAGGSVSKTVEAKMAYVPVPPVINSFTASCPKASPTARTVSTCTLSWNVSGPSGTTVSISGIGTVGLSGSTTVKQGGTYTLTATSAGGSVTRTAQAQ